MVRARVGVRVKVRARARIRPARPPSIWMPNLRTMAQISPRIELGVGFRGRV